MIRRSLIPLLLICAFAPAVLAASIDLRASLSMPPTTIYNADPQYAEPNSLDGWATVNGTLTLINAGTVPAERVTFDLDGLGLVGDADSLRVFKGVTCSGTRCTLLVLPPGSLSLPVYAHWFSVPAGTVRTTSVTVSSTRDSDPDLTNNTASANTTILWQSNLTLDAFNVPSSVASGQSCAIAAHCSNHGPSRAADMTLTISIPPGARYEGYLAPPWFDCAEPQVGGHGDLVCTGPSIGLTSDDVIQALVSVDPSLAPGTVLTMNGTLTSTSAVQSPLTASGSVTVTAPIPADAALSVAATVDKPSVVVEDWATETYTVFNAGPRDAKYVTLDVRLPEGALAVNLPKLATWTFDSCSGLWPTHCTAVTLAPGATMTLSVMVPENATGRFTSTAVVTWLNGGPVAASNALLVTSGDPARRRAARH